MNPEPPEAAGLRDLIAKVHDAIVSATKDLRDAGTSSIATTRAKAKLQRLRADEEHLLAQLQDVRNRKPIQGEESQARSATGD
jgi:hypothetical protein